MNNGDFKNFYPIEKINKPDIAEKNENLKYINKKNIINIGQLILICFLFAVIIIQTVNIISNLSGAKTDSAEKSFKNTENLSTGANNNQNITENNINNIETESNIIFILGENNGRLAILSPDKNKVYEVFDVYINTLPDFDKNLLTAGIKIKSTEELRSLLEDYSN